MDVGQYAIVRQTDHFDQTARGCILRGYLNNQGKRDMASTAYKAAKIVLTTSFLMSAPLAFSDSSEVTEDLSMETVIVTATRQAVDGFDLGQAWANLDDSDVERIDLQHSNQLFNRVSGAWVSRGYGQESLISLRSPVLTGAVLAVPFSRAKTVLTSRARVLQCESTL